jgi:hypothetical protein
MKYILNIGLEGDIYGEVITQLNNLRGKWFDNYHVTEKTGEYNGAPEQTAVITLDSKAHYSSIEIMTKKLCKSLKQECIPFAIVDKYNNIFGSLIYNNDYLGKQQNFNRNYFITKH